MTPSTNEYGQRCAVIGTISADGQCKINMLLSQDAIFSLKDMIDRVINLFVVENLHYQAKAGINGARVCVAIQRLLQ